jgi:hypothetical protein
VAPPALCDEIIACVGELDSVAVSDLGRLLAAVPR